jgi:hypothetical protein
MSDDFFRSLIAAMADAEQTGGAERLAARCWPGGSADRSEPVALNWVRRWHPARSAAALPVCSCHAGRCAVCN